MKIVADSKGSLVASSMILPFKVIVFWANIEEVTNSNRSQIACGFDIN
jgi:hypothetical protein